MADNKEALPVVAYIQHHKAGDNLEWEQPGGKFSALTDHATATAALSELRAEVERLRVDAERLDWIERNREAVETHWTAHAIGLPDTFHGFNVRPCDEAQLSLRAAIDAARSAASGESAEGGV